MLRMGGFGELAVGYVLITTEPTSFDDSTQSSQFYPIPMFCFFSGPTSFSSCSQSTSASVFHGAFDISVSCTGAEVPSVVPFTLVTGVGAGVDSEAGSTVLSAIAVFGATADWVWATDTSGVLALTAWFTVSVT